jgi:hypothetical protein
MRMAVAPTAVRCFGALTPQGGKVAAPTDLASVLKKEIDYEAEEGGSETQLASIAQSLYTASGFKLEGASSAPLVSGAFASHSSVFEALDASLAREMGQWSCRRIGTALDQLCSRVLRDARAARRLTASCGSHGARVECPLIFLCCRFVGFRLQTPAARLASC